MSASHNCLSSLAFWMSYSESLFVSLRTVLLGLMGTHRLFTSGEFYAQVVHTQLPKSNDVCQLESQKVCEMKRDL